MAKYSGKIGYASYQKIHGEEIVVIKERQYYGDILNKSKSQRASSESANDVITLNTRISIVSDPFAKFNKDNFKYVTLDGARWKIESLDSNNFPRMILELGGVYNGPLPENTSP